LLDSNVNDHPNSRPGNHGGTAFKAVHTCGLLVAFAAEARIGFGHVAIRMAFDLQGPGGWEEIHSSRKRRHFDNRPHSMVLQFLKLLTHSN
jgi:hypothetical protein